MRILRIFIVICTFAFFIYTIMIFFKFRDTELFSNGKFDINFVSQHWPLNCCHHAISVIKMCNWIPLIYPKVRVHSEDVEL